MRPQHLTQLLAAGVLLAVAAPAAAGRIEGSVERPDGSGLGGVTVTEAKTGQATMTDPHGGFHLSLPPGTYELLLEAAGNSRSVPDVEVAFAATTNLELTLDWPPPGGAERTMVTVSPRTERAAEAPVSVTALGAEEVAARPGSGSLAGLLAPMAGIDAAQTSLYEFSLSARGFNVPSNKRLAVRIDGFDVAEPFFGGRDLAALTLAPIGNLAQLEVARGPVGAVHGPDASGGIVSLVTRRPAQAGGRLRLAGGEPSSFEAAGGWQGRLPMGWHGRLKGGHRSSGDFSRSRVTRVEYSRPCAAPGERGCLPLEATALTPEDDSQITSAGVRLDRAFPRGGLLSLEAGLAEIDGPVLLSHLGRLQRLEDGWSWSAAGYASDRWRFRLDRRSREADRLTALATGDNLVLDHEIWTLRAEGSWGFREDQLILVAGVVHRDERVDSTDPSGPFRPYRFNPENRQTLLFDEVRSDADAFYTRADLQAGELGRLVVDARYDESSLHDSELSARLSYVYAPVPGHALRMTFRSGFETPSYAHYFLASDRAAPVNLAAVEPLCALEGVFCGFDLDFLPGEDPALDATPDTRQLAVGNRGLEPPRVNSLELGYAGPIGGRGRLRFEYHRTRQQLISDLLPLVGTRLGRINPGLPAYQPPATLSPASAAAVTDLLVELLGPLFPFLTIGENDTPILALTSFADLGRVESQGIDVSLKLSAGDAVELDFGYSWLDVDNDAAGLRLADLPIANAPSHKASLGMRYRADRWDATASYRWVDDHRWAFGPFDGLVDAYGTVGLALAVELNPRASLRLDVTNLLDDEHWEAYGGDLIGRRALGSLIFSW